MKREIKRMVVMILISRMQGKEMMMLTKMMVTKMTMTMNNLW